MSDRMAAEIWIGGKIPMSLVPALCAAISDEGVSLEWGDAPFRPSTADDFRQAPKKDDHAVRLLWLCDEEAGGGVFEELEAFLREHEIAYTRQSTGHYEIRPGIGPFPPWASTSLPRDQRGGPARGAGVGTDRGGRSAWGCARSVEEQLRGGFVVAGQDGPATSAGATATGPASPGSL